MTHSTHRLSGKPACLIIKPADAKHAPRLPPLPEQDSALDAWRQASFDAIKDYFERTSDAPYSLFQYSNVIDALIGHLYQSLPLKENLSILAVGGYGRQDLFPHSDIDLVFLHSGGSLEATQKMAQHILYPLWNMHLKVGHAVRTVEETIGACRDHTVLTAMLDMRHITGQHQLTADLASALEHYKKESGDYTFVRAKLDERDVRHKHWGDSRFLLEPNVKEGKGGLRDLHTIYWLARYCYQTRGVRDLVELGLFTPGEYRSFKHAERFLSVVRMHLHYMSGRGDDRLNFAAQCRVAEALGFRGENMNQSVERFMKRYFLVARTVGNLTRIFCAMLEADKKRAPRFLRPDHKVDPAGIAPFIHDGARLSAPEGLYEKQPAAMMQLFAVAEREQLDIHPRDLQRISRLGHLIGRPFRASNDVNAAFLSILLSPHTPEMTLRRMSEAGLLGRFIPDFARVTGQMQFDMYHIYTVDEHILRVVGILHDIAKGRYAKEMPVATEVMPLIASKPILFVAAFTHDIAKGRGGEHARKGAEIARSLALQLGLSKSAADTVCLLVEHQELLTETAFKRDLGDLETYRHLAENVRSLETLRLLFLLTVGDVRAVGPHVWNGWKGLLLRDLYRRAERYFQTGSITARGSHEQLREELTGLLPGWSADAVASYLSDGDDAFLSSRDAMSHSIVAHLVEECREGQRVAIHFSSHEFHAVTEMTVVTEDRGGLLADVAGAISSAEANIVGARIATLKSGWAVQSWQLQDFAKQAVMEAALMERIRERIRQAVTHPQTILPVKKPLPSKLKPLERETEIFIDNDYSSTYSLVEVNALDRIGLLSAICRAIQDEGGNIASAYISTYGEKAVDVFYVKDRYGFKFDHKQRIETLKRHIVESIEKLKA